MPGLAHYCILILYILTVPIQLFMGTTGCTYMLYIRFASYSVMYICVYGREISMLLSDCMVTTGLATKVVTISD